MSGYWPRNSGQMGCDQVGQDRRNHADAQRAANVGGEMAHLRGGLLGLVQDLLREGIEAVAGVGEPHRPALARKQLRAERLLEAANLLRERGLRDTLQLRRLGEAAGLDHRTEIAELMNLHNRLSCDSLAFVAAYCIRRARSARATRAPRER